jgi:hypothetical protein
MQRLKLLGLAMFAVFALGAAGASVASAETAGINMLPGAGTKFSFASTAGEKTRLETLAGTKVECSSVSGKGEATSDPLGTVTFNFVGCEIPGLAKCTGLSNTTAGEITVKGEYHFRYLLPSPNSGVQLVILIEHVHFSCSIVLVLVLGCVSSMNLEKSKGGGVLGEELVKSYFVNFLQEKGDQKPTEIDNEAGTAMEACTLKTMKGTEEYESSGQLGSGTVTEFTNGGNPVTILLMH